MAAHANRPSKGIDCDAALKRWSDPDDYAAMAEFSDVANRFSDTPESLARRKEYKARRVKVEDAFVQLLKAGVILASGRQKYSRHREIIEPSDWDELELEVGYDLGDISGENIVYEKAEFFEPTSIPSNIKHVPDWVSQPKEQTYFVAHDPEFRHVTVDGKTIPLGDQQAKVVKYLAARLSSERGPWATRRDIEDGTGVSTKPRDLFGKTYHWTLLLLSDEKGCYRLRDKAGLKMIDEADAS